MIQKIYKYKNKIVCYIRKAGDKFRVCTGKPSDFMCLSWQYNTMQQAEETAQEYYKNFTNKNFL